MSQFEHQRHKPLVELTRPRQLVLVLPPMRSNVNLSRIARAAGCFGVSRILACGNARVDAKIARDAAENVTVETRRSIGPVLERLRLDGYELVGLEQTTNSESLYSFNFARRTALIIGHERYGLTPDILGLVQRVAEIPTYGLPYSHNAATAAAIAMYEYCRQFPKG